MFIYVYILLNLFTVFAITKKIQYLYFDFDDKIFEIDLIDFFFNYISYAIKHVNKIKRFHKADVHNRFLNN